MSITDRAIKRMFDLVMATLGLVLLAPVIGVCWCIAALETGRNGFFIQERVGRYGKLIRVCKIRTMHDGGGCQQSIAAQHRLRITRSGHVFRQYKLDELPQLFNVVAGSMSFVGPRPDVPGYADRLTGADRVILSIRPGITGPASIKYRDEESLLAAAEDPVSYNDIVIWPDKVSINRDYLDNYSFGRDLRLILQTISR